MPDGEGIKRDVTRAWLQGKFDLILFRLEQLEGLPDRVREVEQEQASMKSRINTQGGILGALTVIGSAIGAVLGPRQ